MQLSWHINKLDYVHSYVLLFPVLAVIPHVVPSKQSFALTDAVHLLVIKNGVMALITLLRIGLASHKDKYSRVNQMPCP